MDEVGTLFLTALAVAEDRLGAVPAGAWARPTPCTDWDVRAVAAHVVDEARWVAPLLAGGTIDDIGPTLPKDPLGKDPAGAIADAGEAAEYALSVTDLGERVHLSYGDVLAEDYLRQVTADLTVHSWDLSRGAGIAEELPAELVGPVLAYAEAHRDDLSPSSMFAGPQPVPADADDRTRLLALYGRRRDWSP